LYWTWFYTIMVLQMPRPFKHPKTGVYYFRQKTPADLRQKFGKAEVSWTLETKLESEAIIRNAEAVLKQAKIWQSLRATPSGLPHKQLMALVGKYRERLDATLEDEPGEVQIWEHILRLETAYGSDPDALERWAGAEATTLLQEAGIATDAYSRARLLGEMHKARIDWATYQRRRAEGDYSPDPRSQRFPEWQPLADTNSAQSATSGSVTITELFELWKARHIKANKSPRSVGDFGQKIASLREFLGHDDAEKVTGRQVDEWCDHLLESGLTEKTVGEKYLAAVKAIFKLGLQKYRITSNPVAANSVRVPQKVKERPAGFVEVEAQAILRAALVDPASLGKRSEHLKRAIRWVPWICAYTGSRGGEVAQMRREDLIIEYDVPCLRITPEGGSVKSGKYRIVPIHSHLIEVGLLDFIASQPPGPMFATLDGAITDPLKLAEIISSKAKGTRGKVGEWVRDEVGITDVRVGPNHGWRHRFKTLCRDVGIDREVRNAIQGHSDGTAASDYGEVTIKAMRRAIEAFPRVEL
jgi:integrase